MEGLGREGEEEIKFTAPDARDYVDYEKIKDSIREKYCFKPTGKVSESNKDLGDLARAENYMDSKKESSDSRPDKEFKLCELKKNLLAETLDNNSYEIKDFWSRIEKTYCDKFDGKDKNTQKRPLPFLKRRTILDGAGIDNEKSEKWSRKAIESFMSLKNGNDSEKIGNEAIKKVLGSEMCITDSKTDIYDKVDSIGFTKNTILLLQIKTKMLALMEKSKTEIIQEVNSDTDESEKKRFFEGCKRIEAELGLKGKGMIRKIWLTIPTEYKRSSNGKNYDERLEIEISKWFKENGIE